MILLSFRTPIKSTSRHASGSYFNKPVSEGYNSPTFALSTQLVNQFVKQSEKAELSEEQTTKAKEIMTKVAKEVTTKRTEAGITAEMMKKRVDARKKATEDGKKRKEVQELLESAAGFTDEQKKLFEETETQLSKARIEVGKLISPEQAAKLPDQVQASLKEKKSKKNK